MFRRRRRPEDFSAELKAHLEIEADRLRQAGRNEAEAIAASRRAFGKTTLARERFFERSRRVWLDHLAQDVRHTLRTIRRAPMLTAAILGTVTLGIGGSALVFSVVRAVLLRPLPYERPQQLVQLWDSSVRAGGDWVSFPNFRDWSRENRVFKQMAAYRYALLTVASAGAVPDSVLGVEVTDGLFTLLGAAPIAGRTILPGEDGTGDRAAVAVISHGLWQRRFGGDAGIAGRDLIVDGQAYTVVGVMPGSVSVPSRRPRRTAGSDRSVDPAAPVAGPRTARQLQLLGRRPAARRDDAGSRCREHGVGGREPRGPPSRDQPQPESQDGVPAGSPERRCAACPVDPDGGGRLPAGDRLRQHRRPSAVASRNAARREGDRHAHRARRPARRRGADDRAIGPSGDPGRRPRRVGRGGRGIEGARRPAVRCLAAGCLTFAGTALVLMLVAALAVYLPSRRAAAVDPVVVLRET